MTDTMIFARRGAVVAGAVLLGACTVLPTGPSVMVLPGAGQSIERFRDDEQYCRQYAHIQIGGKTAGDAAKESAVTSAAVGTAIGAVAGAAIGGGGRGAATGAGVGLLMGSAVGSDAARASGIGTQRHPVHVQQGAPGAGAGQHGLSEGDTFRRRRHSPAAARFAATAAADPVVRKEQCPADRRALFIFGRFFRLTVAFAARRGCPQATPALCACWSAQ